MPDDIFARDYQLDIGTCISRGWNLLSTKFGVVFENGDPNVQPVINGNVFKGVSKSDQVVGSGRRGFAGKNSEK